MVPGLANLASAFIEPSAPVLQGLPPRGEDWIHEVKFDGYRGQIIREGRSAAIFSRNGNDLSGRFPFLRDCALGLRCKQAIIDCEIVALDEDGQQSLSTLMRSGRTNRKAVRAWCFDIMMLNGRDLRNTPLRKRRAALLKLLAPTQMDIFRFSEAFDDPVRLLAGMSAPPSGAAAGGSRLCVRMIDWIRSPFDRQLAK